LGIGGGWYEAEYEAYGYEFPRVGVRLAQLHDAINIIKTMWSEDRATYEGKHFVARDAILEPKPLHKPGPRVLIGGGGEQVALRIVAQEADMCNFLMATPEVFAHKRSLVEGYCRDMGRDPTEIEYTKLDRLCLATTAKEADAKWEARGGRLPEGYRSLVGSPEQAIEQLKALGALGCQAVFVSVATDDQESLDLFAKEVIPAFS
jgi:alkanesulfonate monooxygenase SsuD/methylene tetrahydromethanopterin reductase-like flavin-dependent oxidoreductase (luciferase family)